MKKVYGSHWCYKLAFLVPLFLLLRFLLRNLSIGVMPDLKDFIGFFSLVGPLIGFSIYFLIKQATMRVLVSSRQVTFESVWGGKTYDSEDIGGY